MQRSDNMYGGRVEWLRPVKDNQSLLDELRAESMADEGGAAGALIETEEPPCDEHDLDEVIPEEDVTAQELPHYARPRPHFFSPLALGTATALSRLVAQTRIRFGRRAASRSRE